MFCDIIAEMFVMLLIAYISNKANKLLDGVFIIPMFYTGIYCFFAYLSIKENKIGLKIITILSSTFQGVIAVVLVACIIFAAIRGLVNGIDQLDLVRAVGASLKDFFGTMNIKDDIVFLIIQGYYLENLPILTIVPMVVSIVLYSVYIIFTPISQIVKLEKAFKIVKF